MAKVRAGGHRLEKAWLVRQLSKGNCCAEDGTRNHLVSTLDLNSCFITVRKKVPFSDAGFRYAGPDWNLADHSLD